MKTTKQLKKLSLASAIAMASAGAFADTPVSELSRHVELYGVLDFGVTWVDDEGGDSKVTGRDSVNWGNRLGFKGSIPLAPGYNGVFKLEHGLKISDGATSQYGSTWGRQAYAGVESEEFGTLTYGRQYDFMYENFNQLNIGGYATTYAGHHGDLDRISGWRVDNSVKYVSPSLNGFKFGVMYSSDDRAYALQGDDYGFGEAPLETLSAGASYFGGTWSIATAYVNIKGDTAYPLLQAGVPSLDDVTMYGAGVKADREIIALGGFVMLGDFALVLNTSQTTLSDMVEQATQTEVEDDATQNVYEIGGYYPIADKTLLIGGFQHSELEDYDFDQVTVGVKYDFTDAAWLYASYSYMEGSDDTYVNQGAAWYLENSSDNTQQTARIGMILTF